MGRPGLRTLPSRGMCGGTRTRTDINIEALCAEPPEEFCPQPEPNATELPSCTPISARTAQRQGGGGGGVARRARAARAPKPKSCATSFGASSTTPCAASFTCSSFMCHLRAGVCVGGGSRPGRRAPQHTFFKKAGAVGKRARSDEETVDDETFGGRGNEGSWGQATGGGRTHVLMC